MPNTIELDISMLPPTPNRSRGTHWAKAHRIREDAGWAVMKAWTNHPQRPGIATYPAVIDVTIHSSGRPGDQDNAWARCKPILDALVERRLLVDDSPRWLSLGSIRHEKAPPRQGHITIRITYQDGEAAA